MVGLAVGPANVAVLLAVEEPQSAWLFSLSRTPMKRFVRKSQAGMLLTDWCTFMTVTSRGALNWTEDDIGWGYKNAVLIHIGFSSI